MRKFKVSFEVETDEKGFCPYSGAIGAPARLRADLPGGMYYAAIVSADAKIEEINPPLGDGYYYNRNDLYRRINGVWEYRSISGDWQLATCFRVDDQHKNSFYVGPLRNECDD